MQRAVTMLAVGARDCQEHPGVGYPRRMRRLSWMALWAVGCAHAAARGGAGATGGAPFVLSDELRRLSVPPGPESGAAARKVDQAAERGDGAAAWAFLHYELDLFDYARFAHDAPSRALLIELAHA